MAQTVEDAQRELEASQKRCTALLAQTNQIEHSMKVRVRRAPPRRGVAGL
jgi:hypothetical protein